ncbi:MAG: C25 family cysteine peptidase [Flavobacteriales bacterium]
MKRVLLGVVWVLLALGGHAQTFGNEWIKYDHRYWSLNIPREGVFRIDSTTLADAGVPLGTIDSRGLQIYGRQRQQPIYVEGEEDGVFNATDFIEFYAQGNDAWMDSALWDSPVHISNPYYSMVCDTVQYFLTYGPPEEALRARTGPLGDWRSRTAIPWWWGKGLFSQPNVYAIGDRTSVDASNSMLNEGEGYFDAGGLLTSGTDAVRNVSIYTPEPYLQPDAPPSVLELAHTGLNNAGDGLCPNHHLRVSMGALHLMDTVFTGYRLIKRTFSVPSSLLGPTTTSVTLTLPHDLQAACSFGALQSDYPDQQGIAYQTLCYPRQFDLRQGFYFTTLDVPAGVEDTVHVAFNIWGGPTVYAFGPTVERLSCVFDNGLWHMLVPMTLGQDRHLAVCSSYGLNAITALTLVNGDGYFHDPMQGLEDSALVIVAHQRLMDQALAYAHYRGTNPYNRYNTIVADVGELYQQFGGGVPRHPMAIRRYVGFLLQHAPSRPRGLFLIGKSVRAPLVGGVSVANSGYRSNPAAAAACLVPSFGYPPSDMAFTLGLAGNPRDMVVPVGRLAARTPLDVQHYLEKVQSLESMPPAAWMKNILHFRGGFNSQERTEFDGALEGYRRIAEDTCFSGHVMKFVKNGAGVIETASADSVNTLINQGVTLMTFFAHAFGGGFDITIDDPLNYQWNGKYPMIIGNSCYSGNIHLADAASASEQFVLPGNAGAIAFLSSVDIGLSYYLRYYTEAFYRSFSQVNYGKSIGEHMRYAAFQQLLGGDLNAINSAQTFTLHGDPTVVLNSPRNVDYQVTDADVRLAPAQVTADRDSFQVKAVVRNIGKGTNANFSMAVERTLLEEGQLLPAVVKQVSLPHFQDTVTFTLPTLGNAGGQGLNALDVRANLDPQVVLDEVDLTNNRAHLEMQVTSGDLLPVYPYDLAITPDAAPLLQASTAESFRAAAQLHLPDRHHGPVQQSRDGARHPVRARWCAALAAAARLCIEQHGGQPCVLLALHGGQPRQWPVQLA